MIFIQAPQFVPLEVYTQAIDGVCAKLVACPGVLCIYQVGRVSTPGISDLDLVVVFDDETSFTLNPIIHLPSVQQYLFVHGLFGVSKRHFTEATQYTFFHNYRLLWGVPPPVPSTPLSTADQQLLKRQVALEYLLRIFVSFSVELTYGMVKLRNLFLHAKALLYDCNFLGICDGAFHEAVSAVVTQRNGWFDKRPNWLMVNHQFRTLYAELGSLLSRLLLETRLYLPLRPRYRVARNISIRRSPQLRVVHRGIRLLPLRSWLGRSYFNVQHLVNRFEFLLPFYTEDFPRVVRRAFDLQVSMDANNRHRFPHFMNLSSNLNFV